MDSATQATETNVEPRPNEAPTSNASASSNLRSYNLSTRARDDVPFNEVVIGVAALFAWLLAFSSGLLVPTESYRNALLTGQVTWVTGPAFFIVVTLCYTVTNLFFLCCAASFVGCMTRRWYVTDGLQDRQCVSIPSQRMYLTSILRGFLLYLMLVAGLLVASTENGLLNMQFGQYIRIAGMASVLAFVVGYDPNMINRFISRVLHATDLPQDSVHVDDNVPNEVSQALTPLERILTAVEANGELPFEQALEETGLDELDLIDALRDQNMEIEERDGVRVIRTRE